MDRSVSSGGRLEVSVSFGRFESDVLSWEKWSSFSPNKHLEEVGNLSTPGSVAQKAAYFDAHYKKIAARKAEELLEKEKQVAPVNPALEESRDKDFVENCCEIDEEFSLSNDERLVMPIIDHVMRAKEGGDSNFEPNEGVEVENGVGLEEEEEGSNVIEEIKDELRGDLVESEPNVGSEVALVDVKCHHQDSQQIGEESTGRKKGVEQLNSSKRENSNKKARELAQKVVPTKTERNLAGTKKKSSPSSDPKHANTASNSTSGNGSRSKLNGLSSSKSKNFAVGESNKGAPPTSLHMSLSLDPTNSSSMTRKSLIMEKMGDKDIVKRAFKTFQNHPNGSSIDKKSTTSVKGNQRSLESTVPDKKNTVPVSPPIRFRSEERAEKRKEFLKKLEAKSIAREAENAQLSAKSKEEKESEIKEFRKSLNFKAKPLPSFYRGQKQKSFREGSCSQ